MMVEQSATALLSYTLCSRVWHNIKTILWTYWLLSQIHLYQFIRVTFCCRHCHCHWRHYYYSSPWLYCGSVMTPFFSISKWTFAENIKCEPSWCKRLHTQNFNVRNRQFLCIVQRPSVQSDQLTLVIVKRFISFSPFGFAIIRSIECIWRVPADYASMPCQNWFA